MPEYTGSRRSIESEAPWHSFHEIVIHDGTGIMHTPIRNPSPVLYKQTQQTHWFTKLGFDGMYLGLSPVPSLESVSVCPGKVSETKLQTVSGRLGQ